jgi:Protein of unknown function (DUF3465)
MGFRQSSKSAAVALLVLAGCAAQTSPDDSAVCNAYSAGRSHVEVVADGRVTHVLGIQNGHVSPHEGFLMRLNSGCSVIVRVEVNTDLAGTFPVSAGDPVTVKGEYEYYSRGGVIHWTHHDPRFHHEAGFITIGGKTYQ